MSEKLNDSDMELPLTWNLNMDQEFEIYKRFGKCAERRDKERFTFITGFQLKKKFSQNIVLVV